VQTSIRLVYNYESGGIFSIQGEAISANCTTDINGNYQVTFPGCNSNTYLQIPNGYNVVNIPYSGIDFGGEIVQFNTDTANNYLIVMPTIQIKPQ
jgi:hypothetical protein